MDRRAFIAMAGAGVLATARLARAQQARIFRLAWLCGGSAEGKKILTGCFLNGLRQFGWIEGQNFVIEYRWSEGVANRFAA
jgi:putative ABC transport system substrate-binding protein